MIEGYLTKSAVLKLVFLLVDIRHEPSENDCDMYRWIVHSGLKPVVIATKKDKINRSQVDKQCKLIRDTLRMKKEEILIPFSAENKQGRDEIWELMDSMLQ